MGSSGKKKTTMAKLARENRLRERRLNKQAKKDARKQASSDHLDVTEDPMQAGMAPPTPPLAMAAAAHSAGSKDEGFGSITPGDRPSSSAI
jgi:hypothetical protein